MQNYTEGKTKYKTKNNIRSCSGNSTKKKWWNERYKEVTLI